ncbi:MAG: PQQ-binding-like beta-propeller repeat protein [Planctomycetes bacterium]|nr:PQQ-binding-like beta-propeller repeat protein [Planctomycetota bacterium]
MIRDLVIRRAAVLALAAALAAEVPLPARAQAPADEVFLRRSPELAARLELLDGVGPGSPPEKVFEILDGALEDIRARGSCFCAGPDGTPREVLRELRARFARLPPELRSAWLRHAGAPGELSGAEIAGGAPALAAAFRAFPLSPAAAQAARLLARMASEAGDDLGALRWLREASPAGGIDPADAPLAAFCLTRLGWFEKAAEVAALGPGPGGREERPDPPVRPRAGPPAGGGFLPAPGAAFPLRAPDLSPGAAFEAGAAPPVPYRPLAAGDALYLPARRGIEAVDRRTGRLLWRFPEDPSGLPAGNLAGLLLQPVLSRGEVALSFGPHLAVFDAASGRMRWEFGEGDAVPPPPGGRPGAAGLPPSASLSVPVPFGDGWLAAMTAARGATECFLLRWGPGGELRWSLFLASGPAGRRLGRAPQPRLALDGSVAYVATGAGVLVAVDAEGPRFLWGRVVEPFPPAAAGLLEARGRAPRASPVLVAPPLVYALPEDQGRLWALDAVDGETAWSFEAPAGASLAGVAEGRVLLCGRDEAVCLDRWTGSLLWARDLPGPAGGAVLAPGRALVALPGAVLALGLADGAPAARLDLPAGEPPGFGLATVGDAPAATGWAGVALLEDASAPGAGLRARFAGRVACGRFGEALALLGPGGGKEVPAAERAAAAARAAEAGALDEAEALYESAAGARGAEEAVARALLSLGRAERKAGRPLRALTCLRRVLALPGDPAAEEGGVPWPAASLAQAEVRALLADAPVREAWEREARHRWEAGVPGGVAAFRGIFPFSSVPASVLRGEKPPLTPERAWLLWTEGASLLPGSGELLDVLAACLRETSRAESDQAHVLLGRAGAGEARLRAPALAGPALEKAWHAPAGLGAGFAVVPRWLPQGTAREPGVYAGGAEFLERLHPRHGWTVWRRSLGSWSREAAWADGVLAAACLGSLRGLDPDTGEVRWSASLGLGEGLEGARLLPGRKAVAAVFPGGRSVGFEAATGRKLWESKTGGNVALVRQDPVTGQATVHFRDGSAALLDPDAGPVPDKAGFRPGTPVPAGRGRALYLSVRPHETEAALVPDGAGEAAWACRVPAACPAALVDEGAGAAVLLPAASPSPDRPLFCLDLATGAVRWRREVPLLGERAWIADGRLFAWTRGMALEAYWLDTGGKLWEAPMGALGAVPQSTVLTAFAVAVGTGSGFVLLNPATGAPLGPAGRRFGGELGRVSALAPAGGDGLLAVGERGTALFSRPREAGDWAPAPGASPLDEGRLAAGFLLSRGEPWAGAGALERRLRGGERVGCGPGDPEFLAVRGAVEGAAFRGPRVLRAARFSRAPVMDGELDDPWDESCAVRLSLGSLRFPTGTAPPGPWKGDTDASAVLYAGWDEAAFYFALEVADDVRLPHDQGSPAWKGDAVVVAVDRLGDGGYEEGEDDTIFWMATMAPRPEGEPPRERGERVVEQKNLAIRPREGGGGAVYELALPWEEFFNRHLRQRGLRRGLVAPARPGLRFGLNLLVVDDDGDGPGHYLALAPGLALPPAKFFREGVWPQLWARVELR